MHVPSTINVAAARLPQAYEAAKVALANCASLDECQEWANKAEALASYAKQADDDSLRKLADRIQARAVRRCGELLKTFDARGRPSEKNDGAVTNISQRDAASSAGISERQRVTAVRVANVPEREFNSVVDSDAPPTVTKLAEMGRQQRQPAPEPKPEPPLDYTGPAPIDFVASSKLAGNVHRFAEFCAENDPVRMAGVVMPHQIAEFRRAVAAIDSWLDRFVINLPGA